MSFIVNDNSVYKQILDEYKLVERAKIHSFHRYYGKLIPAIPDAYIEHGNVDKLKQELKIDASSVTERILETVVAEN